MPAFFPRIASAQSQQKRQRVNHGQSEQRATRERVLVGRADAGSSQLSLAPLPQARRKRAGRQEGRSVDVSGGLRQQQDQQPSTAVSSCRSGVSSPAGLTPQRAVRVVRLALQVRASSAARPHRGLPMLRTSVRRSPMPAHNFCGQGSYTETKPRGPSLPERHVSLAFAS